MKIDWNKDSRDEARIAVSDAVMTSYVSEAQLPDEFSLSDIAREYARTYDHAGNDSGYVVAQITDMSDDETITFAFDGRGGFEWRTDRAYVS